MQWRSSYSIFYFRRKDALYVACTLLLAAFVYWEMVSERLVFYYYPMLMITGETGWMEAGYVAFAVLCFLPFLLEIEENRKWNYLQSKI